MTQITRTGSGDSKAIKSDDTEVAPDASGNLTLGAATYYIPISMADALQLTAHLKWSSLLAATITVETCNFPRYMGDAGSGTDDVKYTDTSVGNWIKQNPSTAYVPVVSAGTSSATNATVTAAGDGVSGCEYDLSALGARRGRIKLVVTTGGTLRCNIHGKD